MRNSTPSRWRDLTRNTPKTPFSEYIGDKGDRRVNQRPVHAGPIWSETPDVGKIQVTEAVTEGCQKGDRSPEKAVIFLKKCLRTPIASDAELAQTPLFGVARKANSLSEDIEDAIQAGGERAYRLAATLRAVIQGRRKGWPDELSLATHALAAWSEMMRALPDDSPERYTPEAFRTVEAIYARLASAQVASGLEFGDEEDVRWLSG